MAYNPQPDRILAGGINLVAPGDLTPAPDSLELQNWRVDQAGALRSRRGMVLQNTQGYLSGGKIHTLFRAGLDRYAGVGGRVLHGADLRTEVTTGFSGDPLGMVAYQGFRWVMNPAKQGKIRGAATYLSWVPDAPVPAPSVSVISSVTNTVSEFENDGWVVRHLVGTTLQDVSGYYGYSSDEAISGNSLWINAHSAGFWWVDKEFPATPLDCRINGSAQPKDAFVFWVRSSNPSAIRRLAVVFTSYNTAQSAIWEIRFDTGEAIGLQPDVWRAYRINRLKQDTDTAEGFTDYGVDWSAINNIRISAEVTEPCEIRYDRAYWSGGVEGALTGNIQYFYTYATDDGHESNPSPGSTVERADAAWAQVYPAPSTDPSVTVIHIYRAGGSLETPLRVGTILNGVPYFSDQVPDETAQTVPIEIPTDNDPPPPAYGMAGPYFGKLIAYRSAAHPQRYWWTPTGRPWAFPGAADESEGNWQDCGADSEAILKVTRRNRQLTFYKERSIWRLVGDPDTNDPEQTSAEISAVGAKCIAEHGAFDYFMGPEGVYRFNGDTETDISQAISPIFKGDWTHIGGDTWVPPIAADYKHASVLAAVNGRLWLSYPEEGKTEPSVTLVYDIGSGRWYRHRLPAAMGVGFTELYYEGSAAAFLGGITVPSVGAAVFELESGLTDDNHAIPVLWQSRFYDQGLPQNPKVYQDLVVDYQTSEPIAGQSPSNLTLKALYDDGEVVAIGTLSSASRKQAVFTLNYPEGRRAKRIALRVEGDVRSTVVLYGIHLHYYVEPREAMNFDTGVVDLGTPLVKEIEGVDFDVTATDCTGSLIVYGDSPGGFVGMHISAPWSAGYGRRTVRLRWAELGATNFRALRFRFVLHSFNNPFQLWAFRVRMKPVGHYLSAGEQYESAVLAL